MMLRYALRSVRARKAGFLGAFLALMCAAALITACGTLLDTGLRGTIRTERYAASPVVVSADQNVHQTTVKHKKGKTKVKHKAKPIAERAWLPASLESTLARTPGVARVVPELTFFAQPLTPTGTGGRPAYGHAWDSAVLTPYRLVTGSAPHSATDLVIDRDLAERARLRPGDRLTVQSTQAPRSYRITGIAAPTTAVRHQASLFFSTAEAQRLAAHPGQVTAFGVLPAKGTSTARLRQAVVAALHGTGTAHAGTSARPGSTTPLDSTAQVTTGDARGPVEFLDAAAARIRLVSMGGAMGGTSLLVAILVVVGTFTLSVQQRHRELALLRAVAATSAQIRSLLGREALIVGTVAGAAGALLGLPLGTWLYDRFVALGAVPATLQHTTGAVPPLAALAVTVLGAWAAARIASRRISRIHPAQALAEAGSEPGAGFEPGSRAVAEDRADDSAEAGAEVGAQAQAQAGVDVGRAARARAKAGRRAELGGRVEAGAEELGAESQGGAGTGAGTGAGAGTELGRRAGARVEPGAGAELPGRPEAGATPKAGAGDADGASTPAEADARLGPGTEPDATAGFGAAPGTEPEAAAGFDASPGTDPEAAASPHPAAAPETQAHPAATDPTPPRPTHGHPTQTRPNRAGPKRPRLTRRRPADPHSAHPRLTHPRPTDPHSPRPRPTPPRRHLAHPHRNHPHPTRARLLAGLPLLALGIALVALLSQLRTEPASTPVTFLAVVVLSTSVALLGPLLVKAATFVGGGTLRRTGPCGRLAVAHLRGNATRMASVVTPLTLLIGMTCTVLFVQPTLGDAARAQVREGVRADWVVASQGPGVPADAARQLRARHDVVTEVVRTTVRVGLAKYAAQGVTPAGLARTWNPDVTAGSLRGLTERTAAVSELAADQLHLKPGSTLKLTLGDGTPRTLTVVAVYARGLGFGDLTFAHDLVARHVDNPLASSVLVSTTRTQTQLATTLREFPGVQVLAPADADSLQARRQQANTEVNYLAMGLVLAFTAIAVVNTLAMSVAERVRELALLRLAGATRRQVLRMLRTEALSVLVLATALGSGIALAVLTAFSVGMTGRAAPSVEPLVYLTVIGVAGTLALVATALPGRVALRVRAVTVATARQ
ncbi:FtsX-like permease family protein [Streptomyces sp. NPDC088847]|uniref:FtsX-like permease family protein n=1 Tax=Streptomyces sp. NPDC088847 TaxID=3365909 RepID=UPI0038186142